MGPNDFQNYFNFARTNQLLSVSTELDWNYGESMMCDIRVLLNILKDLFFQENFFLKAHLTLEK